MDMAAVDTVTMNTAMKFTNTKDLMTASMVLKDTIIKIEYIVRNKNISIEPVVIAQIIKSKA